MSEEKIKLDGIYRTRDGRKVNIYAVDGGGDYPVHGVISDEDGKWKLAAWKLCGAFSNRVGEYPADLVPYTPAKQVPLDGPEDLVVRGFFYAKKGVLSGGEEGGPHCAVRIVDTDGVTVGVGDADDVIDWNELYSRGWQYAATLDGPWHDFSKSKP